MTRETLEFLAWLVSRQTVEIGAPDARTIASKAFHALDEISAALDKEQV